MERSDKERAIRTLKSRERIRREGEGTPSHRRKDRNAQIEHPRAIASFALAFLRIPFFSSFFLLSFFFCYFRHQSVSNLPCYLVLLTYTDVCCPRSNVTPHYPTFACRTTHVTTATRAAVLWRITCNGTA